MVSNLLLVSAWNPHWWQALNPVSWSLICEAFFYAAFPAVYTLLLRVGRRSHITLTAVCIATVFLLPWANTRFSLGWTLYSFPLARLPEFILGAAIARLVQVGGTAARIGDT
ncbi:acyltransferase family protein [Streptomyces chartreusis]|uniref:acyltransferase family protein n=1 Tax=Streptomyces chartreusis TaxID=1969 RepID=UPI00382A1BE5